MKQSAIIKPLRYPTVRIPVPRVQRLQRNTSWRLISAYKSKLNDPYEKFRKFSRDQLHCMDIGHSDSPEDPTRWTSLNDALAHFIVSHPNGASVLLEQHKETIPSDLRLLAAKRLFAHLGGFGSITHPVLTGEHVLLWPETSTFLIKAALKMLHTNIQALKGHDSVVLFPEGNFRYNYMVDEFAGVQRKIIPVDPISKKITSSTLLETIRSVPAHTSITALVLETPNNPWMQVYHADELRTLVTIATQARKGILIINDLYLLGTEEPGYDQCPIAAVIDDNFGTAAEQKFARENLLTVIGTRRIFGADKRAKAGFCISHNEELIAALEQQLRSAHMRWYTGRYKEVQWLLNHLSWSDHLPLRSSLTVARQKAEHLFAAINGMKIIVPSKAGPFITVGFTEEIKRKMQSLGFASKQAEVLDGEKIAEYVTICGSKTRDGRNSVTVMPLSTMFTDEPGFRINATVPKEDLILAIKSIKNALQCISDYVHFRTVQPTLLSIYQRIHEEQLQKLTGV